MFFFFFIKLDIKVTIQEMVKPIKELKTGKMCVCVWGGGEAGGIGQNYI